MGLKGESWFTKTKTLKDTHFECVAFTSFLEWNSDPEIADAAEKLYANIENLELYVGLQAEEAKPLVEGAGLCPGTKHDACNVKIFKRFCRLYHQPCHSQ